MTVTMANNGQFLFHWSYHVCTAAVGDAVRDTDPVRVTFAESAMEARWGVNPWGEVKPILHSSYMFVDQY